VREIEVVEWEAIQFENKVAEKRVDLGRIKEGN
jgi:hypothetical protein